MLMPADLKEWVAGNDLVHFVVEAVSVCDMRKARVNRRGTGDRQYPPTMMLALLIYSYATGTFSSRKIERQTYESVGVRYVCANTHPDHDTIAKFRRENGELIHECFVKVLELAKEMGLLRMGTITMDGTKMGARAAKRRTLEARELRREVERCLKRAGQADEQEDGSAAGTLLPEELGSPERRLARLREAQQRLEAREREDDPPGPGGGRPARVNTTDPDSALQPTAQGPFIQGYNAQLCTTSHGPSLIVAARVTNSTNDRRELEANLRAIDPRLRPSVQTILADTGYDNSAQIRALERHGLRVLCPPQKSPRSVHPVRRSKARQLLRLERDARRAKLDTPEARGLYRRRAPSVEPVFHVFKNLLGLRQFLLRGLRHVALEWELAALAFNCRKLASARPC
jgi:transposase